VNSGALRHRVSIQRRSVERDELGQPLDEWVEVVNVWADITDRRGREMMEATQATINEVVTDVRVRYRQDILPEMRVVEQCHARREFNIMDVRYMMPPRPEVMLECRERRVEVLA
jgi:SPP1 family predicted phage head-tail adaptor